MKNANNLFILFIFEKLLILIEIFTYKKSEIPIPMILLQIDGIFNAWMIVIYFFFLIQNLCHRMFKLIEKNIHLFIYLIFF